MTRMIDGPKEATFSVWGAICAPRPSCASAEEWLEHPQNDHGLRGNRCFAGAVEWHRPLSYLELPAVDYHVTTMCGRCASFLPAEAGHTVVAVTVDENHADAMVGIVKQHRPTEATTMGPANRAGAGLRRLSCR